VWRCGIVLWRYVEARDALLWRCGAVTLWRCVVAPWRHGSLLWRRWETELRDANAIANRGSRFCDPAG